MDTGRCTAGLQVFPFHQELFRHCVCGLMPSNHINSKSASTSYENNLKGFILLYIVAPIIAGGLSVLLLLALALFLSCLISLKQIFLLTLNTRGPNSRKP